MVAGGPEGSPMEQQHQSCAVAGRRSACHGAARRRVLVVEDDMRLLYSLARDLRIREFDVLVECRGDLGLQTALDLEPDALVLDLNLPGMRGTKILDVLREKVPHLPVVVCTGDLNGFHKCIRWGNVARVFTKPFFLEDLSSALTDLLSGWGE